MKIRYKHQRFQTEATKCVSDVFQGQPKHDGSRTFLNKIDMLDFDGFGNLPLVLDNESICENLRGIQMAEGLKPVKHVYFVAETKGKDIEVSQLRRAEDAKIECARRHFAAISTGEVVYSVVKTYQDLYNVVTK